MGTFGYEPEVSYFFGFPRAIEPGGVAMDMDRVARFIGASVPDPDKVRGFNQQVGFLSSALEHTVPEQMFVTPDNPGEAISAVKALTKANAQGQRIYHITPDNQTQTLLNINHRPETMAEIRAALAVGKEVITHTNSVSVPGWSGAGYIIFNPETGDGAYKIGGEKNGGWKIVATFIFVGAVIILSFIARQYGITLFAVLAYINFAKRVQEIASDMSLSEEQIQEEVNRAAFIAVIATVILISKRLFLFEEAREKALRFFISAFVSIFGYTYFD